MNQVIRLTATWCGPCKAYAPIFEAATLDASDRWEAISLDIDSDEGREMMIANNIRSVPTTLFMEFGQETKTVVGAMSQADLEDLLT